MVTIGIVILWLVLSSAIVACIWPISSVPAPIIPPVALIAGAAMPTLPSHDWGLVVPLAIHAQLDKDHTEFFRRTDPSGSRLAAYWAYRSKGELPWPAFKQAAWHHHHHHHHHHHPGPIGPQPDTSWQALLRAAASRRRTAAYRAFLEQYDKEHPPL